MSTPQFFGGSPANHRILGVPGGGLATASWAANAAVAKVGADGERKTAAILDPFAAPADGPTVLHDLMIPSARYTANIDHIVVVGSTVHIIDSKVWKPGRYWTIGAKTRRGWKRFEPADKKTMIVAQKSIASMLSAQGIQANVVLPILVVWPSSSREALKTGLLKVPGAAVMSPQRFSKYAKKEFGGGRFSGARSADPRVVAALVGLLSQT